MLRLLSSVFPLSFLPMFSSLQSASSPSPRPSVEGFPTLRGICFPLSVKLSSKTSDVRCVKKRLTLSISAQTSFSPSSLLSTDVEGSNWMSFRPASFAAEVCKKRSLHSPLLLS
jgi:hypothetical protein